MNNKRSVPNALRLLALGLLASGCGDSPDRKLSLSDGEPGIDLDEEHARIQQLQMVQVQDVTNPNSPFWTEIEAQALSTEAWSSCDIEDSVLAPGTNGPEQTTCTNMLAQGMGMLCRARILQSVSSLRAEPMRVGDYLVPPQSSATNIALLELAQGQVSDAVGPVRRAFVTGGFCSHQELQETVVGLEIPFGRAYSELFADAYALYSDVTDDKVGFILAVSDSERGSTTNMTLAQSRVFAQKDLSRAAAAHELVGGVDGLLGSEKNGFCTSPELTAHAQRALDVLRQTGIAPGLVLAKELTHPDFVNGSLLAVPSGSVRERYKVFVDRAVPDGQPLQDKLGLTMEDFIAAREYLASEIVAFNRSLTRTGQPGGSQALPPECLAGVTFGTGTDLNLFDRYIAPASSWSIVSGTLRQGGNQARALAIRQSETVADGYVEARMLSSDNDHSGVVIRYQSDDSYYVFSASEQNEHALLRRYDQGVETLLVEKELPDFDWASPGHVLRLSAQGNRLVGSIDGQSVVSVSDDTYTSGRVGLYAGNQDPATFDDFSVFSTTRASACGVDDLTFEFAWYPATGNPPEELSHEYWAGLARWAYAGDALTFGDNVPHPVATPTFGGLAISTQSHAAFIDTALFTANEIMNAFMAAGDYTDANKDQFAAPFLNVLAQGKRERPGRILIHETSPETTKLVQVYGYGTAANLRLVDGENLSCAVNGHVEGLPCTITYKYSSPVAMAPADLADFTEGVTFTITDSPRQRLYLIKPFDPDDLRPRGFEALAGFIEPLMQAGENHVVPIVPELAKRAADALKPSREHCTHPAVGCDGKDGGNKFMFDARVPLENELTSDGDSVESSWRHYLTLARGAADEAHALAEAYMRAGLELDTLDQQEQLREAQDRIRFMSRAEGELEVVQNICGTAVETSQLLDLLGLDPSGITSADDCSPTTPCAADPVHGARECLGGKCFKTAFSTLENTPHEAESLPRLRACIGEGTVVDYATIGNNPVCAWYFDEGFCSGDDRGVCPSLAVKVIDGPGPDEFHYTCDGSLAKAHAPLEAGPEGVILIENAIGITDTTVDTALRSPCEAIRFLRDADSLNLTQQERQVLMTSVVNFSAGRGDGAGNYFSKDFLSKHVGRIVWRAGYGNHSAVELDKAVKYTTGTREAPGSPFWPCASLEVDPQSCVANPLTSACTLDCSQTPSSLFCQVADCSNWDSRTAINQRMMNAVWALHALTDGHMGLGVEDDDHRLGSPHLYVPTLYNFDNHGPIPADTGPAGYVLGWHDRFLPEILDSQVKSPAEKVIKEYPTPLGGTAYTTASTNPAEQDFWQDPQTGLRHKVGTSLTTIYAIEQLRSTASRKHESSGFDARVQDWSFEDEATMPDILQRYRYGFWEGMSPYDPLLSRPWPYLGAMQQLLMGQQPFISHYIETLGGVRAAHQTPWVDTFAVPAGHATEYNARFGNPDFKPLLEVFPQVQQLVPIFDYPHQSLFDATELFCELTTSNDDWLNVLNEGNSCPAMPVMTVENQGQTIPDARRGLMCQAELLRRRVNNLVLQRVPRIAMQNLLAFTGPRAFPEVGGEMGKAISLLREALVRYQNGGLDLAQEVATVQYNMDRFFFEVKQMQVRTDQDELDVEVAENMELQAQAQMELTELQTSTDAWDDAFAVTNAVMAGVSTGNVAAGSVVAAASIASYIDNKQEAADQAVYQKRIADLQVRNAQLAKEKEELDLVYDNLESAKMLGELQFEIFRSTNNIARITNNMKADLEQLGGLLTDVETLAYRARRALDKVAQFESSEAAITPEIRGVLVARLDVGKRRYKQAHQRAVKYAFLAKRAIEQRLGIRLAEMREDMPLVDAPQKWESKLCSSTGVDYDALKGTDGTPGEVAAVADNADPFIGEYVNMLEDVVESYTLQYGFQDGSDEAVISIRDDVANVREECEVDSTNLLYFTGQLEPVALTLEDGTTIGWAITGCTPEPNGSVASCLATASAEELQVSTLNGEVRAHEFQFGTNATDARLIQTVRLQGGTYRLSWYADNPVSGQARMKVFDSAGTEVSYLYDLQEETYSGWTWKRQHRAFQVSLGGDYTIAFVSPGNDTTVRVAAPFLENITKTIQGASDLAAIAPPSFQLTTAKRTVIRPMCADSKGNMFRRTHWKRDCTRICDQGFSDDCQDGKEECFWQTEFSLSERDIQNGTILSQSGFARGNFNYRIESVGLNFVGTGLRACEDQVTTEPCFAAGFVPYSLHHVGPHLVTNHAGQVYKATLFTGVIEHARGLGTERYLTNPLSSTDRSLLEPYLRTEYQGRPLDGNYRLRVWDAPGLTFDKIEDVQVYLKYRYWTKPE